ncbi:MAG TPA: hypothetical protein VF576_12870, partial [Rubricoccaceae bacterium]
AEAAVFLRAYDARDVGPDDLPAAKSSAVLDAALVGAALARLVAASGLGSTAGDGQAGPPPTAAVGGGLGRLLGEPYDDRRERLGDVLDAFGREADRRTALVFAPADEGAPDRLSRGSVRRWHVGARQAVAEDAYAAARLGAGRALTSAETALVQAAVDRETAFLQRFGGELAVRERSGRPMTEKQVAARTRMYSGSAHALFYEVGEPAQALGPGWVYEYDARDDGGTCPECVAADVGGPYLAGRGPLPGDVCRGRGACRCRRVAVYDPAAYTRLTALAGGTATAVAA